MAIYITFIITMVTTYIVKRNPIDAHVTLRTPRRHWLSSRYIWFLLRRSLGHAELSPNTASLCKALKHTHTILNGLAKPALHIAIIIIIIIITQLVTQHMSIKIS